MRADDASAARGFGSEFVCRDCASPLIQPVDWETIGENQWRVRVRCPHCFDLWDLNLDDSEAHELLLNMDEAAKSMLQTAELLDRDTFRESCEVFAQALRADLIHPMDF
jgi:hypothetical protein